MGFMTPDVPAAAPATVVPPTVTITESSQADTQSQYDALNARRKGLLSTIQAGKKSNTSTAPPSTTGGAGLGKLG